MEKLSRRQRERGGKGPELVSKANFELRRDGARDTACVECQRERHAGAPIVVRLRDIVSQCEAVVSCASVGSEPGSEPGSEVVSRGPEPADCSRRRRHGGGDKNFSAFLSAIEKVHLKDTLSTVYDNLAENVPSCKSRRRCGDGGGQLNNVVAPPHAGDRGVGPAVDPDKETPLLSASIIHNDLHSAGPQATLCRQGSGDSSAGETESSSSSSSSASSSASLSSMTVGSVGEVSPAGSVGEVSPASDVDSPAPYCEQLSRRELSSLAEYTTGHALTWCARLPGAPGAGYAYDAASHDAGRFIFPLVNGDRCAPSPGAVASCSVVVATGPGRVEVSVGGVMRDTAADRGWRKSRRRRRPVDVVDAVCIDLTDTGVTYDVTYVDRTHAVAADYSAPAYSSIASVLYPAYWGASGLYAPVQLGYWVQPVVSIPPPVCVPRHLQCLASKCLCMVPAHQVQTFTASQPPHRPWIPLAHSDGRKPIAVYSVMCYNVLCDKYATRQLYGYCPSWALNWDYRKKAILEEIRQYSADIISLQEVETEQFYNFFLPELKRDGYVGIFSPKSRARTMVESERKHVDGCAIFFRTTKFSLVKEQLVEFNQLAMASAEGSHDMINRVMTKDNIGLAAVLETTDAVWENGLPPDGQSKQLLLVATCHVHWDPEFCDVKLIQTMILMSELKNIIEETATSLRPGATHATCNSIPLLLCGDLNSLPDSGVVEFLNSGKVAANHDDFKDLGYEDCLRKLSNSDNKEIFTHVFNLAQAYAKDVMPYTNYTFDFKGIIDYIFYSRDFLRPLGVLGALDQEWYRHNKVLGCPHPHIPSDHLPLLVEFEMLTTESAAAAAAATAASNSGGGGGGGRSGSRR